MHHRFVNRIAFPRLRLIRAMSSRDRLTKLASMLDLVRTSGVNVSTTGWESLTIQEGYDVQSIKISRLSNQNGVLPPGWKVGATNEGSQKRLNLQGPFRGPILQRHDILSSPASVSQSAFNLRGVEAEFAVVLNKDLPPRPGGYLDLDELAEAVGGVFPAIEITSTRVDPSTPPPVPPAVGLMMADDGNFGKMVFLPNSGGTGGESGSSIINDTGSEDDGDGIANHLGWDVGSMEWDNVAVTMEVDGKIVASGRGADALGHPLKSLAWLATNLSDAGLGLKKGQVAITGTCTGLSPVHAGGSARAVFEGMGEVLVQLGE